MSACVSVLDKKTLKKPKTVTQYCDRLEEPEGGFEETMCGGRGGGGENGCGCCY
jgi:hypothetical protein